LEKPRANRGSELSPIPTPVSVSAILTEVIATAPFLGWLAAQALYVGEPVLEGFFSAQTLTRWSEILEGEDGRK
jgi:hypothetical protein